MDNNIRIVTLPASRWEEYKNLRLESLKKDPQAFGTPYSKAITRPNDEMD